MQCSKCRRNKKIINQFFNLCLECNNLRLDGGKSRVIHTLSKNPLKPLRSKKTAPKTKRSSHKITYKVDNFKDKCYVHIYPGRRSGKNLLLDELFYEQCFNQSNHRCEECDKQLPEKFRDEDGKIIARYRYSHIIPKSIAPELRHEIKNINHLCLNDHGKWENGDKASMKIYEKNKRIFPRYF